MSTIIKLRDVNFDNPALPTLNGANLVTPGAIAEPGSVAHYLLGGSAAQSYENQVDGGVSLIEPLATPSFGANYAEVDIDSPLDTGLGMGSAVTLVAVFAVPAGSTKGTFALGAFGKASATASGRSDRNGDDMPGGVVIYAQYNNPGWSVVTNAHWTGSGGTPGNSITSMAEDTFVWVAYSVSATEALTHIPALAWTESRGGGDPSMTNGQTIHVGNYDYVGSFDGKARVAEAIVFNKALTQSELEGIYARSQARMAARGITI